MATTEATLEPQSKTLETHRVIFLGTPAIAVPTLQALAASQLRPDFVITEPDKPVGRHQTITPSPIKLAAVELAIPVFEPTNATELLRVIEDARPTVGVVVAYGRILKPDVIDLPTHGFVNLHFSLLPKYRGATPIQATILNGEPETGVTMMQIDAGLDTGPIIGHSSIPIDPDDTTERLGARLADLAALMATELLPHYLEGSLRPQAQPPTADKVTRQLTKDDGQIDWTASPVTIERFVRAMNPWPRAWTEIMGTRFIIHEATLEKGSLVLSRIQAAGKRVISGAEFARGYPDALAWLQKTNPTITTGTRN